MKREGQRGARIDPKGCKVRTTKDAQGNKKKENKQGNEKIKRTTTNMCRGISFINHYINMPYYVLDLVL